MSNRAYSVEITRFRFPDDLDDDKANFRLQVTLRYRDHDGEYGIHTVVLPGFNLYWECSKEKNKENKVKPDFHLVRKENEQGVYEPEVDFEKAGAWGKLFRLKAEELYELRVSVFDVDRQGWLDKLGGVFSDVINNVVKTVPTMSGILKPIVDETAATIGQKISNDDDRILVVHSSECDRNDDGSGHWNIEYEDYELEFVAKVETGS